MDLRRLFNEINTLKRRVKNLDGETFSSDITITGDVGIGTTSPDYELDVAGSIGINEYIYHNGDADTYIRFQDNNINMVAGGKSAIKLDTSTGKIQINNTNENLDVQIMADDGNVIFHTDAGTNRVGIGLTSPGCELHVSGNDVRIRADGDADSHPGFELSEAGTRKWIIYNNYTNDNLTFKTNSDIRMSIQQDGDVGVGTQTPDVRLHVKSLDGTSLIHTDLSKNQIQPYTNAARRCINIKEPQPISQHKHPIVRKIHWICDHKYLQRISICPILIGY
jgi:hypothetical protein